MELTAQILREWFRLFNARYFGGELPEPRLMVSGTRRLLGQFSCRRVRRGLFRGYDTVGYTIKVSDFYDLSEHDYQSTLLHEMIHYYITYRRLSDTSSHGPLFRQWMQRLNRDGWHVTVSSRTDGYAVRRATSSSYLLALIATTDGRRYVSVVHPSYRRYVERQAAVAPQVASVRWRVTTDARYATWPRSRSLRGRRLSVADYEQLLTALPIPF